MMEGSLRIISTTTPDNCKIDKEILWEDDCGECGVISLVVTWQQKYGGPKKIRETGEIEENQAKLQKANS